jgi:alpha-tubulin suppressor-like RCC1 family protein
MALPGSPTRTLGAWGACCVVASLATLLWGALPVASARAQEGVAFMSGYDGFSELGDNGLTGVGSRFSPEQVPALSNVVAGSTSYYDTLAVLANGTVEAWGGNEHGELGDGTTEQQSTPQPVSGLSEVTAVAAGFSFGLALQSDGTVEAWGPNEHGELGDGTTEKRLTPAPVPGLSNVVAISAGCFDSFALLANGTVESWGANKRGELGNGTDKPQRTPELIPGLSNVVAISAGCYFALALLSDGDVEGWGANEHGELGDGTTAEQPAPVPIPGLSNVAEVSAGGKFGLALLSDGSVEAWGGNEHGELGDGTTETPKTTEPPRTPEPVPGLSGVVAVSAGADFGLALLGEGLVAGWGNNLYGELGDLTSSERLFSEALTFPEVAVGLAHGIENYDSLVIEGARASVSSSVLAFAPEAVGMQSPTQTIVLSDDGPAPLAISGDSMTGPGAGEFVAVSDGCRGATIAPGATCAIEYAFAPGAAGTANATLTISSSATQPLPSIALSGVGVGAVVGVGRSPEAGTARTVAPSLSRLSLSASAFRPARAGASVLPGGDHAGTLVSYTDSQAATTTFAVQRMLSGVSERSGKAERCAKPPKSSKGTPRRARRCVYFRTLGSFAHADAAGANRLRFSGRVAGSALEPGSYRLTATAHSTGGVSATQTASFTIRR